MNKITYLESVLAALARSRTQQEVATVYASLLIDNPSYVDWELINTIIKDRWSLSGLSRVKKMAWKQLR